MTSTCGSPAGSNPARRDGSGCSMSSTIRSGRATPNLTSTSTGSAAGPAVDVSTGSLRGSFAVSGLGDVAALAARRVDDDAHAMTRGGVDEHLAGRAEARFDRSSERLATAPPGRHVRLLRGRRAVALPLEDDDEHEERTHGDELQPADRAEGGNGHDDQQAGEHQRDADDDQAAANEAAHAASYSVAGFADASGSTTTAVP